MYNCVKKKKEKKKILKSWCSYWKYSTMDTFRKNLLSCEKYKKITDLGLHALLHFGISLLETSEHKTNANNCNHHSTDARRRAEEPHNSFQRGCIRQPWAMP